MFKFFSLLALSATLLQAEDSTKTGEITTPFPTLHHLAIEWQIEGDDDLDATCALKVRKEDETAWRNAQPLPRVPAGASR
jgi:hypothetical protein